MTPMTDVIRKECSVCGREFTTTALRLKHDRGRYCSRICNGKIQSSVLVARTREMSRIHDENAPVDFWLLVDKSAGDDSCWPFMGDRRARGYGRYRYRGKGRVASRLAYLFANGVEPGELLVLHTCDNPPCCNPKHLFLGDDLTNAQDRGRKGRATRHRAKLTPKDVARILAASQSNRSLAREYGVHPSTIDRIKSGKTWAIDTRGGQ